MVKLQQVKNVSKKTGKEYTAYQFIVGDWSSPYMFINSKYELEALKSFCEEEGVEYVEA